MEKYQHYSNTTLVKVKFKVQYMELGVSAFKCNSC